MGQIFNRIKRIIQSQSAGEPLRQPIDYEFLNGEEELTRKINEAARNSGPRPENLRRDASPDSEIAAAFAELGITMRASVEEIKSAYKTKMKKYHPDLAQRLSETEQKRAETQTLRVKRAYELIKKYKNF